MSKEILKSTHAMVDAVLEGRNTSVEEASRRVWLQNFGLISASAAVMWACGGKDDNNAVAAPTLTVAQQTADAGLYNAALALEHEAISVYTSAAGLNVWDSTISPLAPAFLEVAKSFLAHHTTHRDSLTAKINAIKSVTAVEPVATKAAADYLVPYPGIAGLSGATGLLAVLQVAAEREMNAANAYYSIFAGFNDPDAIKFMGGTSADEAAHYGVLNAAAFAFAALSAQTTSSLTAANLVSGAYPAFAYPKTVRS